MNESHLRKMNLVKKIEEQNKQIQDKIGFFVLEYKDKDIKSLEREGERLIKLLEKGVDERGKEIDQEEIELRVEALQKIVDNKLIEDYEGDIKKQELKEVISIVGTETPELGTETPEVGEETPEVGEETPEIGTEEDFLFYPDKDDKDFNYKIFNKQEFYKYKTNKITDLIEIDKIANDMCNRKDEFQLTFTQKFLKNFMSPNTPYNGILLIHGTGVGKTCASISIAEQFKHYVKGMNKKIFVLLSPSIKENFIKNIFDVNKFFETNGKLGCTGYSYLDELGIREKVLKDLKSKNKSLARKKLENKIKKLINKYYNFVGYDKFAGYVLKLEKRAIIGHDESEHYRLRKEIIKSYFSNTLLIIDEAHHLRAEAEENKFAPPIIERVLKHAENIKLILLSATPMYDRPEEIITLLNFLLLNDNRPKINKIDIFNKNGTLKKIGKKLLIDKARGYISYIRGENPINFPLRLYPDVNNKDKQHFDIYRMKHLELVNCNMHKKHYKMYKMISKTNSNVTVSTQVSNIIWNHNYDEPSTSYGSSGLMTLMNYENNTYSYKENSPHIFSKELLKQYSCKIASIIENIDKRIGPNSNEGSIFIYSQYIDSGVIPIALALEENGYSKYGVNELLSYQGKPKGKKGNYIIISSKRGPGEISYNIKKEIGIFNSQSNKNGKLIKVVIGSPSSGEGLNLLRIREIHILEPWHNLNKIEQVIGRGIRNCSHISLPLEKRNVTIFMYSAGTSKNKNTVDFNTYKNAEQKAIKIGNVMNILRRNAIDCEIARAHNSILSKEEGHNIFEKIYIKTSKDVRRIIDIREDDNSRGCNYRECDYSCDISKKLFDTTHFEVEEKGKETYQELIKPTNKDTYSLLYASEDISIVKKNIIKMFKKRFVYTLEDIVNYIKGIEGKFVLKALNEIIDNKDFVVKDMYNREGYIIQKGIYYIFQPFIIDDKSLPMYYRRRPVNIKNDKFNLDYLIKKQKDVKFSTKKKVEKPKEDVKQIIKEYLKFTNEMERRIIIDRCVYSKMKLLYEYVLEKYILNGYQTDENDLFHKFFMKYYKKNFITNKLIDNTQNRNRIIGFMIGGKGNEMEYYVYRNKKIEKFKALEIETIEKNIRRKLPKLNNIYGFIERLTKKMNIGKHLPIMNGESLDKLETRNMTVFPEELRNIDNVFKIVDRKKKANTGFTCWITCTKDDIKTYIEKIGGKVVKTYDNYGKIKKIKTTELCMQLETLLRRNDDIKKDKKRWFLSLEESIIYGIAKVKKVKI